MSDDKQSKWQLVRGDGSSRPIPAEKFTALQDEFEQMAKDAGKSVNDRRELAEDTRYCRWSGQSPDGRKHAEALDGEKPFPFEGASDARVRTADGIGQEQVIVLMASLLRMNLGVKGTEATDMELAADVNVLWRWLEKNQLGAEWFVENTKLAQYRQNDSPAVGIMQVWWDEQQALKPLTITPEQVVEEAMKAAAASGVQLAAEDAMDLQDMLANVARAAELAGLLRSLWPELAEDSAKRAAAELQADGETTVAYPYTCENRLRVKARRLFEDIFVPGNTPTDLQRARCIFVREWFSEPELREKDAKGEFKSGFLEEVLKHEGETVWKHYSHMTIAGDYSESQVEREWNTEDHRGQYEIITAFFRASNKIGIPGIYTVTYNSNVENPGSDMELFDSPKGRYPFFANPREILTDKLWDTRGLAELSSTEQSALKQLHDSFMDHVQLTTLPTFEVPANRPKMALVFQPLGQIKTMRSGEIRPIAMGQYPIANDKVTANIEARVARYFGSMVGTNTPDWVRLYQNFLTDSFFTHLAEVVRYSLALAWEYLPDETLARVLGHQVSSDGEPMEYDVQITFEAGMLNLEFLKTVGEMISQYVLTWDTQGTIQRDKLVRWFFSALSPTLAQELTVPVEQANQREVEDEQKCFTMIAAGIEPPMIPQGQNFKLRLDTEMNIGKSNPEAWDKLTPKSREILEARLKFLEQQVTQQENAQIGRTGSRPALAPEPAAAAIGG